MTDEKLKKWLDEYEQILGSLVLGGDKQIQHLVKMIPKMRVFLKEGRREKLMRWIGFIQGVLWSRELYTLEELKQHNMPEK